MTELAAAAAALGVTAAVLALVLPGLPAHGGWRLRLARRWERETVLAAGTGWRWADATRLTLLQALAGTLGGLAAYEVTDLPVLALVGWVAGAGGVRLAAVVAVAASRRERQDAVVEVVRLLRQLLETGGVGVQQALAVVAERGPELLRPEFAQIVAAGATGRQGDAWAAARTRVAEPVFDLLAAAIAVQRPAGGRLGPLFADLEESVTSLYEVVREGEALQVQARSAAIFILALPVVFLVVLAATRSPYLHAYHEPAGEAFLGGMLAVMAGSYLLIRRLLKLPEPARLRLADV